MSKNKIIIYCYSISLNGTLVIVNYELCINVGVPAIAVGLSAISFSAPLQKDAAPIPNAFGIRKKIIAHK